MRRFDRSVQKELKKYKESTLGAGIQYATAVPEIDEALPDLNLSKGLLQRIAGANASQVEICFDLAKEPDTGL